MFANQNIKEKKQSKEKTKIIVFSVLEKFISAFYYLKKSQEKVKAVATIGLNGFLVFGNNFCYLKYLKEIASVLCLAPLLSVTKPNIFK